MPIPQLQTLCDDIDGAFDLNGLTQLVRFTLSERLENIAPPNSAKPAIVLALVDWADQRGPGMVETLLRGIVAARPLKPEFKQYCEQYFPRALLPFDGGAVVGTVAKGLEALAKLPGIALVQSTVGGFRALFEQGSTQIMKLRSYKALHESLHRLQLQLTTIGDAITRAPTDAGARGSLGLYARDLRQLATRARTSAMGVPSEQIELPWIDDFDGCVKVLASAATSDAGVLERVPERLRLLLSEAPRINNALANLAATLSLDSLSTAMNTITQALQLPANSPALAPLTDGMHALSVLAPRLAGLVAQHYEWQWIEKELVVAELQVGVRPTERLLRWPQFKPRLLALCALDANGEWSQDLQARLAEWETPVANGNSEGAFEVVRHLCLLRFFDVDAELDMLCGQLLLIAGPLNALLVVI
jgi:hypothetical protein